MLRPRRNRHSPAIRSLVRETTLSADDFILPMFLQEGEQDTPIESMPGVTRWSIPSLVREAGEAHALGINAVALFPKIEEALKTPEADESFNDEGLVPRAIRAIKAAHPTLCVITDVALDPYNSDGHDGLVRRTPDGGLTILNPTYLNPMFDTTTGNMLLVGSGTWMMMGVLVMRKMINFEI